MPYAIELFLDDTSTRRVCEIWAHLNGAGVRALGNGFGDHPHVTLSVCDDVDASRVAEALEPFLERAVGLPLPLAPLGFFLTPEAPAFLGVIPSHDLLNLHRDVDAAIEPAVKRRWDYYRPDALLPHCTLAMGVTDKATVIDVVSKFSLPIPAVATGLHVIEIPKPC